MKVAVVGTGYVDLVSGTCFAETGNDVICVDIDHRKVDIHHPFGGCGEGCASDHFGIASPSQ